MKRRNFTKEEIRKAPTIELVIRMNCLHAECKRRLEDAGIPMFDIWEANNIHKEVKRRHGRHAALFYVGGK